MNKFVIIVAGGSGKRMNSEIPKQFLLLNNEPLLMYTIKAFYRFDHAINIVLVLPKDHISFWRNLCTENDFSIKHQIVEGGITRYHSVKNALYTIEENGLVGIHDGVRPLVSQKTISHCFAVAKEKQNAIPVVDIPDSIREVTPGYNKQVNRDHYKLSQTPQVYDIRLIKEAYKQDYKESFTDDASLLDAKGIKLNLVDGNRENIKITTEEDLRIAEALLD